MKKTLTGMVSASDIDCCYCFLKSDLIVIIYFKAHGGGKSDTCVCMCVIWRNLMSFYACR